VIRQLLWCKGFRYRLHSKILPGKPDIVFVGRKKAIFVHGCFWHKHNCRYFKWPETNAEFWKKKIGGNVIRDNKNYTALTIAGWTHLVIWECETKPKNLEILWSKIEKFIVS
jgi:DNA mismatch endonuclease, patch repair protein